MSACNMRATWIATGSARRANREPSSGTMSEVGAGTRRGRRAAASAGTTSCVVAPPTGAAAASAGSACQASLGAVKRSADAVIGGFGESVFTPPQTSSALLGVSHQQACRTAPELSSHDWDDLAARPTTVAPSWHPRRGRPGLWPLTRDAAAAGASPITRIV